MTTTVVLVDDHRLVRDGLRALLESRTDVEVVGEADDGRAAVQLARKLLPDVVVMDPAVGGLNGAGAARQIRDTCPDVKVVALSMHSDKRYVSRMLQAGASAYLSKTCDVEELIHAINITTAGGTYLSPEVAATVVQGYVSGTGAGSSESHGLSDREAEVLQLLAEGKNSKGIGLLLHVSSRTVDSHRQRIMKKLDIHTLAELTKYAIRAGLTTVEV